MPDLINGSRFLYLDPLLCYVTAVAAAAAASAQPATGTGGGGV